jgi:hypothetical protein
MVYVCQISEEDGGTNVTEFKKRQEMNENWIMRKDNFPISVQLSSV